MNFVQNAKKRLVSFSIILGNVPLPSVFAPLPSPFLIPLYPSLGIKCEPRLTVSPAILNSPTRGPGDLEINYIIIFLDFV